LREPIKFPQIFENFKFGPLSFGTGRAFQGIGLKLLFFFKKEGFGLRDQNLGVKSPKDFITQEGFNFQQGFLGREGPYWAFLRLNFGGQKRTKKGVDLTS